MTEPQSDPEPFDIEAARAAAAERLAADPDVVLVDQLEDALDLNAEHGRNAEHEMAVEPGE